MPERRLTSLTASRVAPIRRLPASPRARALQLLWRSSRPLSLLGAGFAEGALPVLVVIAMGRVTGAIPGAVIFGLSSAHGHALLLFERYAQAARAAAAAEGTITLLVSHRFSTVRSADLIVVLEAGRAVESGSHDELMRAQGTYAELFELQARAYR